MNIPRILIVDDEANLRFFLTEAMRKRGYQVAEAENAEAALEMFRSNPFDLVILDSHLPGINGVDAIPKFKEIDPDVTLIIMTAYKTRTLHQQALEFGAYDFFTKPFKMEEMNVVIRRALERRGLQTEVRALRRQLDERCRFENIIGSSPPMREVFDLINKVVTTDVTVLICGESGTGKELIAEAIHRHSARRDKPFVKLNCVAIPEGLLESELFGHEKGSFTGAITQKVGKFELANGGTIFLDEIGDMTLGTQSKILRVLQEREFERVGGTQTIQIDVRVITATNKDLAHAVQQKTFREDLYYRLNVFSINVPPLRARKQDIPALVEHFLKINSERLGRRFEGLTNEAMALLMQYDWPGNVRELENYIQRAVVLAESDTIGPECLPTHLHSAAERAALLVPEQPANLDQTIAGLERQIIVQTLRKTAGLQSKAAKLLGITERSLWHRVKKLKINVDAIKSET